MVLYALKSPGLLTIYREGSHNISHPRRQAELLQQASQLRDAESYLASVNTSTDNLQTTLNRVRGDIVEPYTAIASAPAMVIS